MNRDERTPSSEVALTDRDGGPAAWAMARERLEGLAVAITDPEELERVTERFRTATTWPLEVRGGGVHGPNAPTAGPPPYAIFRLTPSTVFGLPGMTGMEQFDPEELPRPTRWRF